MADLDYYSKKMLRYCIEVAEKDDKKSVEISYHSATMLLEDFETLEKIVNKAPILTKWELSEVLKMVRSKKYYYDKCDTALPWYKARMTMLFKKLNGGVE